MAFPSLCIQRESVSNYLPTPTFVLGKWRQLSDRLVSNFIVRQMSFMFGPVVITGLRHRCSSTVKPAVSPFKTLTLMSVAHCQVQTWHPLSLHYVKRVTCRTQGRGGGLIAWDILDLHVQRKYFVTAINCSLEMTAQQCGWDALSDFFFLSFFFFLMNSWCSWKIAALISNV